jgi:putative hemolysin
MDDVGRLWRGLLVLAAAAVIMGFFTVCGNAVLRFPEARLNKLAQESKKARRIKFLQDNSEIVVNTNGAARIMAVMLLSGFEFAYLYNPFQSLLAEISDGTAKKIFAVAAAIVAAGFAAAVFTAVGINLPKKLCTGGKVGESFIMPMFGIYSLFLTLFKPLRLTVSLISGALARLFGVKDGAEESQVTGEEILQMLDAANENGGIEDDQAEMISNIFEFSDMEVHEVMTHRTEISAVEHDMPVAEAVKLSVETGVSRIPVYKETIDNICGVIYVKDLLPLILKPESQPKLVSEYMHKIKYVPETGSCGELFRYFNENKKQIAVVLDEYGGTAGIVTMEDLLECIVGNIRDEFDGNEAEDIEEIAPNTFDILGGADPDDVMERLGNPLADGHEFDTMAGFVTDLLGYIPADGETPTARFGDVTFAVIKAKDNRIEKIRAVKDNKKAVILDEE